MPILSLQDVSKDYLTDGQTVHALCDLSLSIERRRVRRARWDAAAAAESTLLNLFRRMDFPTSGLVFSGRTFHIPRSRMLVDPAAPRKSRLHFPIFPIAAHPYGFRERGIALLPARGKPCAREAARERLSWVDLDGLGDPFPGINFRRPDAARAIASRAHSFAVPSSRRRADRKPRHPPPGTTFLIAPAADPRKEHRDRDGHAPVSKPPRSQALVVRCRRKNREIMRR